MTPTSVAAREVVEQTFVARPATFANIADYGTLVEPTEDGAAFGAMDAALHLTGGKPRFYIMRLKKRTMAVTRITRHLAVTQALASLNGKSWYVLLAPPDKPDDAHAQPDISRLQAFCITGSQALVLHRSTWHAGPYFVEDEVDFVNLELSDTNIVDHHTTRLDSEFGLIAHIVI